MGAKKLMETDALRGKADRFQCRAKTRGSRLNRYPHRTERLLMPTFKLWINPLKFLELDLPGQAATPTADQVLNYLSDPELNGGIDAFLARYREVANVSDPLFVAPAEKNILQKLVWPLRHAKGSYALGNSLGCIAMCGMVGEMVAILLWDISKVPLQGKPREEPAQKALFGSSFERLGQERRVQVLRIFGLIDEQTKTAFDRLREIRRRYLHFFPKNTRTQWKMHLTRTRIT